MTTGYFIAAGLAIIAALTVALWLMVQRNADLDAENDAQRGVITDTEDFNDAVSNPDGLSWRDRLFPDAAD